MYTVYWIGANGNVYQRIGDTVVDQGKLIKDYGNGFDSERVSSESTRIDDPNAPAPARTTTTTSTATAPKVVNTAAVDATQQAINSLGTEQETGYRNIDQSYGSLIGGYDREAQKAEADYGEESTTNNQNLSRNKQNALVAAAQGARGLRGTLAAIGALGGTGVKLANRAVTQGANEDIGEAAETFAGNQRNLDKAVGNFRDEDKRRRDEAGTQLVNQRTALEGSLASKRQQFYQKMAELFAEGGNDAEAARYLGMAGGLNQEIASKTAVASTPFTARNAAFTPGTLEQYLAGAGDMTVKVAEGGTGADLGGPTSILAGRGRRRKEDEELVTV